MAEILQTHPVQIIQDMQVLLNISANKKYESDFQPNVSSKNCDFAPKCIGIFTFQPNMLVHWVECFQDPYSNNHDFPLPVRLHEVFSDYLKAELPVV